MKKYIILIKTLSLFAVINVAGIAHGWDEKIITSKGANKPMETYYLGRFSIAMPAGMKEAQGSRSHQLRYVEIKEVLWPESVSSEKAREAEWNKFVAGIMQPTLSYTANQIIIKTQDFPGLGKWAKGVFYHISGSSRTGKWSVLIDTGSSGVWLKTSAVVIEKENNSNKSVRNIYNIGKNYGVMDSNMPKQNLYYLKQGSINLPYSAQEESDVRFEDHSLSLTLRIEMHETYEVEKAGLIESTIAVIASGYAGSLNIEKIRSHKRTVGGLNGEEEVLREIENKKAALNFVWEYQGKVNSGECPRIVVTMDSPDENLEEKLEIWDAVLDSMKPMFVRKQ